MAESLENLIVQLLASVPLLATPLVCRMSTAVLVQHHKYDQLNERLLAAQQRITELEKRQNELLAENAELKKRNTTIRHDSFASDPGSVSVADSIQTRKRSAPDDGDKLNKRVKTETRRNSKPVCEGCQDSHLVCDGKSHCSSCKKKSARCSYISCKQGTSCDSTSCCEIHADQWCNAIRAPGAPRWRVLPERRPQAPPERAPSSGEYGRQQLQPSQQYGDGPGYGYGLSTQPQPQRPIADYYNPHASAQSQQATPYGQMSVVAPAQIPTGPSHPQPRVPVGPSSFRRSSPPMHPDRAAQQINRVCSSDPRQAVAAPQMTGANAMGKLPLRDQPAPISKMPASSIMAPSSLYVEPAAITRPQPGVKHAQNSLLQVQLASISKTAGAAVQQQSGFHDQSSSALKLAGIKFIHWSPPKKYLAQWLPYNPQAPVFQPPGANPPAQWALREPSVPFSKIIGARNTPRSEMYDPQAPISNVLGNESAQTLYDPDHLLGQDDTTFYSDAEDGEVSE